MASVNGSPRKSSGALETEEESVTLENKLANYA